MSRNVFATFALVLAVGSGLVGAEERYGGPEISGSLETSAAARTEDGALGLSALSRIALDARPAERASFRAELSLEFDYGALSDFAAIREAGLASTSDLAPGMDPRRLFAVDQAYASVLAGPVDLRAGIVPIAWGTAYVFNPTARLAAPRAPGEEIEVEPGTPSLEATLALPLGLSLSGYAAFKDRTGSLWPSIEEGKTDMLPWGAKLQYRGDYFDVSVSFLREMPSYDSAESLLWAGADAAGSWGPVDLYAEVAFRTDGDAAWVDRVEAATGLAWTVPRIACTVRAEYAYLGTGAWAKEDYDWASLAAGTRATLGRDYLFLMLEREDPGRWALKGGGLVNLDDTSWALAGEASWMPVSVVEVSVFCELYFGEDGSEYDGRFEAAPGLVFDATRPMAGVKIRIDF